jgi:hypothetical protein
MIFLVILNYTKVAEQRKSCRTTASQDPVSVFRLEFYLLYVFIPLPLLLSIRLATKSSDAA